VLRQVHSLFQSVVFRTLRLNASPLISSILSFPYGHPVSAYVFFPVFSSLPSLLRTVWPFQSAFFVLLYLGCSFLPWLFIILRFSYDRSNWSWAYLQIKIKWTALLACWLARLPSTENALARFQQLPLIVRLKINLTFAIPKCLTHV